MAREVGNGILLELVAGVVCFYAVALAGYRIVLWRFPLQEGLVTGGSAEFAYCTYMLLLILVFSPLVQILCVVLPFPFRRPLFQLLGTRAGKGTNFVGIVVDPPLAEFGDNVAVGMDALISGHSAEGKNFVLARVRVGNRVTIGGRAIILPGVTIGDDAIVGAGAVVLKGTQIGARELWGGVPARRIKMLE